MCPHYWGALSGCAGLTQTAACEGVSWDLVHLREQKWRPSTSPHRVSHMADRRLPPGSGRRPERALPSGSPPPQREQQGPPPLHRDKREHCSFLCPKGRELGPQDTPFTGCPVLLWIKWRENERPFSWLEILQTGRKLSCLLLMSPRKNGSFSIEEQRDIRKTLAEKHLPEEQKSEGRVGWQKDPMATSLSLFYFSDYLVIPLISRDVWEWDALLGIF